MGKKDKAETGAGSGAAGRGIPPAAVPPAPAEEGKAGSAAPVAPEPTGARTVPAEPSPAATAGPAPEPPPAATAGPDPAPEKAGPATTANAAADAPPRSETRPVPAEGEGDADRTAPPDREQPRAASPPADASPQADASPPPDAPTPADASPRADAPPATSTAEAAPGSSPATPPAPEASAAPRSTPEPAASAPPAPEIPHSRAHAPEYQELWLSLARRRWNSIVVVPADRSSSSEVVAKALAEVGKELAEDPVTAITVSRLEYDQARTLTDLQLLVGKERERLAAEGPDPVVDVGRRRSEPITVAPPPVDGEEPGRAIALMPRTRLVISIPAVVSEPLGVAVAQYADGVVLTVQMGSTRLEEARRTIELIGRERILGCFLLP